jgi:hypothetical protein
MMSRFDDLQIQILHVIWQNAYKPNSNLHFHFSEVNNILPENLRFGASQAAIDALVAKGYLDSGNGNYWITEPGILFIENGLADSQSAVSLVVRDRDRKEGSPPTFIPASDRVVPLDHNSDPYREAISALDAAVTEFRADHRLENEWGPEKRILILSIEAGQQLLKEGAVHIRTVLSTTIEPLRIIADRYRDAITAGLITAGVDHVLPLIERAISALFALIGTA